MAALRTLARHLTAVGAFLQYGRGGRKSDVLRFKVPCPFDDCVEGYVEGIGLAERAAALGRDRCKNGEVAGDIVRL